MNLASIAASQYEYLHELFEKIRSTTSVTLDNWLLP
jgi:hypothetical protein